MSFWVYMSNYNSIGSITGEEMAVDLATKYPNAIYFEAELVSPSSRYVRIRELESSGVLGPELCPDPYYWHWPVVKKELLPEEFLKHYEIFGEIRYY